MGRLVLTVFTLVILVAYVFADSDSHEHGYRRRGGYRRNDDRGRDDRDRDDRGRDDRNHVDRRPVDRGHDDKGYVDRGHDDRRHGDRRHDDRSHENRDHDDRGHGGRRPEDRRPDDRGHGGRRPDDRGHGGRRTDDRGHGSRRPDERGHGDRNYDDRDHGSRGHRSSEESLRSRSNEHHSGQETDDGEEWTSLTWVSSDEDTEEKHRAPENPIKKVKMPSGDEFDITSVNSTGWTCSRATELVDLKSSDAEYGIVANEMEKTKVEVPDCSSRGGCVKKFDIIKIQKVVNGCYWDKYRDKQLMTQESDNVLNEMMLFHGTSAVDNIIAKGFDERYTNEGPLGAALYFVTSSSIANQYVFPKTTSNTACTDCERRLLLNRVSLGNVYKLDKAKDDVKANEFGYAPMGHNSVMAKRGGRNYDEYAVYRGDQAYPEYVITYKIKT